MRTPAAVLLSLWVGLAIGLPLSSHAGTDDISAIIEGFVTQQFPDARSHFWVINGPPHQVKDEVVLDVNTTVTLSAGRPPAENRFLLLIVSGRLAAVQHIPLAGETVCQSET